MPEGKERIGVFICGCGGNISDTVDVEELRKKIEGVEGVVSPVAVEFLCSKPNLEMIKETITKNELDRVVVACCSPAMHETLFKNLLQEIGMNPNLLEHVNLREHCSWVHHDKERTTRKAVELVKGGIYRAKELEELSSKKVDISKEILVIGGGISGITSALQLANSGFKVHLIERSASIGGHMAQLSKTFPTLDCSPCILSPKMVEVSIHPNIKLRTYSEVESVSGNPGNFHVKIRQKSRRVDSEKCLGCGKCSEECPEEVSHEFEEGLYKRKAIYKPFPQAVPTSFVIDPESCIECGSCVDVCPADAIDLEEEDEFIELDVGAIIVATGFDSFDPSVLAEYNYQHDDVITAMQMERLMIMEAGEGKALKRLSNGKRIKKIAYLLCVGSRDVNRGVPYCCKICCTYAIKQAILLKKNFRYMDIWLHFIDIRTSTRGCEEFYMRAQQEFGIKFLKGRVAEVSESESGALWIRTEDTMRDEIVANEFDLVVLCPAILPSKGMGELAKRLSIPLGADNFIAELHPKLAPVQTHRVGIFAAGCALGPKDIHDCVTDGKAAASQAIEFVGEGKIDIEPIIAVVDQEKCNLCMKCIEVCPVKAISVDESLHIDDITCIGCGACVPECPEDALDLKHYTDNQIMNMISGLLEDVKDDDIRIIGFFGDLAYTAADSVGVAKMDYSPKISIIKVPSTARVNLKHILHAFEEGADGVLLSDEEEVELSKLTEKRIFDFQKTLEEMGIKKERIKFMPMFLPTFRVMPKHIDNFIKVVDKLGKLKKA